MSDRAKDELPEALTDADLDTAIGAEVPTSVVANNILEPRDAASGPSIGTNHKKWLASNFRFEM